MSHDRTIGFAVRCLSNQFRRCVETHDTGMAGHGLTGIQGWTLGYLAEHSSDPVYQYMLEDEFQVRRSTMTEILNGLERNGLLSRTPDPSDGRKKRIVLTEQGMRHHREMCAFLDALETDAMEGISKPELAAFFAVADKISQNLKNKYGQDGGTTHGKRNE